MDYPLFISILVFFGMAAGLVKEGTQLLKVFPYSLLKVLPMQGRRRMEAASFLHGYPLAEGQRLGA